MSPVLLLALVGLLYVLIFGGLSVLRREGASVRFAIEAVVLTAIAVGVALVTGFDMNPAIFLALLYLITMRARLLVDLANFLARRHNTKAAEQVYGLALRLWPDDTSRLIVQLNRGVLALHSSRLDEAIAAFGQVLSEARAGSLGLRHESACHYNLGVAYLRKGLDAQATLEFNTVLDAFPATEYARYAAIALERRKRKE